MAQSGKNQRSKVLVDPQFQVRMAWRIGGLLVTYLSVFFLLSVLAPAAIGFLFDDSGWAIENAIGRFDVFLHTVLLPLVFTFGILAWRAIVETHRIAGPAYRFNSVLRDVRRLRIPRGASVREHDHLQDTARALDEALVDLHDHVATMRRHATAVRDARAAGHEAGAALDQLLSSVEAFTLLTRAPDSRPLSAAPAEAEVVEPADEETASV